jgi:hypothetical protein
VVAGNIIGLDSQACGTAPNGNGVMVAGALRTTIGGTSSGWGNLISANSFGIQVTPGSDTTNIFGNFIGTDVLGGATEGYGNANDGIFTTGCSRVNVGNSTDQLSRNVISGNGRDGIAAEKTFLITVVNTYIGVDVTGQQAIGNKANGVRLDTDRLPLIGGSARNVISANYRGIRIDNCGGGYAIVQNNYIGVNADGNRKIGNTLEGVRVRNFFSFTIGGTTRAQGNLISGNKYGIDVADPNTPDEVMSIFGT